MTTEARYSTVRPAPPPKPSYLSVAQTGTLSSEAFRTYVREHSLAKRESVASAYYGAGDPYLPSRQGGDADSDQSTLRRNCVPAGGQTRDKGPKDRRIMNSISHDSGVSEIDEDEDCLDDLSEYWGTARQTPVKAQKPALADLFRSDSTVSNRSSQLVVQPLHPSRAANVSQTGKERANIDHGTRSLDTLPRKRDTAATLEAFKDQRGHEQSLKESNMICLSPYIRERSREPSILSHLSALEDDDFQDDPEAVIWSSAAEDAEDALRKPSTATNDANIACQTSPSRANWMNIRDGSSFDFAGPMRSRTSNNQSHDSGSKVHPVSDKSTRVLGLPPPSEGISLLITDREWSGEDSNVDVEVSKCDHQQRESFEQTINARERTSPIEQMLAEQPLAPLLEVTLTHKSKSLSLVDLDHEMAPVQSSRILPRRPPGREARALYAFNGEVCLNELVLAAGQVIVILNENIKDNWTLAAVEQSGTWIKGFVPQGWFIYIQEMARSPKLDATLDSQVSTEVFTQAGPHQSSQFLALPDSASSSVDARTDESCYQSSGKNNRPASGVGYLHRGTPDGHTALENLARMSRSISAPSVERDTRREAPYPKDGSEMQAASEDASSQCNAGIAESTVIAPPVEQASAHTNAPITPTWRPPGLLRGHSINRYAPFVASGAESYALSKREREKSEPDSSSQEAVIVSGRHDGPAWKQPDVSITVEVHSPEIHSDEHGREYTAYVVHSSFVFAQEDAIEDCVDLLWDPYTRPEEPSATSSVYRRFNQFRWLAAHLYRFFAAIMQTLPPLPTAGLSAGKNARFAAAFVETRRRYIQSWLVSITRHPVLSQSAGVRYFLDCEDDGQKWARGAQEIEYELLAGKDARHSIRHIFDNSRHPLFNFDADEANTEAAQQSKFAACYERLMSAPSTGILDSYNSLRQVSQQSSNKHRDLSCAILRLITGASAAGNRSTPARECAGSAAALSGNLSLPPMGKVGERDESGATNEQRAWCWREGCVECHRLTRALQRTAEAMQVIADFEGEHANGGLFEVHERLWTMSKALSQQTALLETHRNAMALYHEATREHSAASASPSAAFLQSPSISGCASGTVPKPHPTSPHAEQVAARCETVLNVTLSEMDRLHTERVQDWSALSRGLLDEQIDLYESMLSSLRAARASIGETLLPPPGSSSTGAGACAAAASSSHPGPILPSPFETQLRHPVVASPLLQPSMPLTSTSAATALAAHPVETLVEWLSGSGGGRGSLLSH